MNVGLLIMQFEYEKWKMSTGNLVMLYPKSTQKPVRINRDASVDASGEYNDPSGNPPTLLFYITENISNLNMDD